MQCHALYATWLVAHNSHCPQKAEENHAWYEPLFDSCSFDEKLNEGFNEEELVRRPKEVLLTLCPLWEQIVEITRQNKNKKKKSPPKEWPKMLGQLDQFKIHPRCEEPVNSHIKLVTVKREAFSRLPYTTTRR